MLFILTPKNVIINVHCVFFVNYIYNNISPTLKAISNLRNMYMYIIIKGCLFCIFVVSESKHFVGGEIVIACLLCVYCYIYLHV